MRYVKAVVTEAFCSCFCTFPMVFFTTYFS